MELSEITCDTPLESILNHETVSDITDSINRVSALMQKIYNRAKYLDDNIQSGGLGDAEMIDDSTMYKTEAQSLYNCYDSLFSDFPQLVDYINDVSRTQETSELNVLKRKVNDKLSGMQETYNNTTFDDNNDDDEIKKRAMIMDMSKYETKLELINSRLSKIGSIYLSNVAGSMPYSDYLINTSGDNNDKVYAADYAGFTTDDLTKLLSSSNRSNWSLGFGRFAYYGKLSKETEVPYDFYNQYYTTSYNGKNVTMICSTANNTKTGGLDSSSEVPIVYIMTSDDGHQLCYDKAGNPISYNTAMNILEADRVRNVKSLSSSPSALGPTWVDTGQTVDNGSSDSRSPVYEWQGSVEDEQGNRWASRTRTNPDTTMQDVNFNDSVRDYEVFEKDKGESGTIYTVVDKTSNHEMYYGIKQSDGSYLYYDTDNNPISQEDVKNMFTPYM